MSSLTVQPSDDPHYLPPPTTYQSPLPPRFLSVPHLRYYFNEIYHVILLITYIYLTGERRSSLSPTAYQYGILDRPCLSLFFNLSVMSILFPFISTFNHVLFNLTAERRSSLSPTANNAESLTAPASLCSSTSVSCLYCCPLYQLLIMSSLTLQPSDDRLYLPPATMRNP